jgi:hypothetical protein
MNACETKRVVVLYMIRFAVWEIRISCDGSSSSSSGEGDYDYDYDYDNDLGNNNKESVRQKNKLGCAVPTLFI